MNRTITIFDTTLRDGEQSPGASMNLAEKMEIAQALVDLGVDVIEGGFPIASVGDFEAVREIAQNIKGAVICGLARCNNADIDRAWEALCHAERPRIHVFLATSAIHREFKLKMDKEEIVRRAVAGVERAVNHFQQAGKEVNVEFSPEDAARTEVDFLCEVVEKAIAAGANTVNIPDTVGYATPSHMGSVIRKLRERVPNIDQAVISIHCHNDLGLAVANSLAAVEAGAGQIECTINGIGERAGNCSLEEVVMAMRVRGDYFGCDTRINSQRLVPASRLVANVTGIHVQRNKAIVGRNAFAHEAGIHQDGMLKEPSTYEIMRPADVGFTKTDLVLGKHSGRAAFLDRARQLGYHLTAEQVGPIFEQFKHLADKKKDIYDSDIAALIEQEIREKTHRWRFKGYDVRCASGGEPHVKLALINGDGDIVAEHTGGDGPVDAAFRAIENATGISTTLKDYSIRSVSVGKDAQAECSLEIDHHGQIHRGRAVSTDTLEASILAYLDAVNRVAGNE